MALKSMVNLVFLFRLKMRAVSDFRPSLFMMVRAVMM